jgi:hypothetical protein
LRDDADELPQFGVSGWVNRNAADEVEFPDEAPGGLEVLERPIAVRTAPSANDTETAASPPAWAHINDEFVFGSRDDEGAEHLPALSEAGSQV